MAIYYYLEKISIDTVKKKIETLHSIWKDCSNLKHNSNCGCVSNLTYETLSEALIDFFTPEQKEKYNKWLNHFSKIEDIIKTNYKFYLDANKN